MYLNISLYISYIYVLFSRVSNNVLFLPSTIVLSCSIQIVLTLSNSKQVSDQLEALVGSIFI